MLTSLAIGLISLFIVFLLGLTAIIFLRPPLAASFFRSFASSAKAHYLEQALRIVLGAMCLIANPYFEKGFILEVFGWTLVITSLGLLLLPWRWHQRFAKWVIPPVIKYMSLYAVGLVLLAALLLWILIHPIS